MVSTFFEPIGDELKFYAEQVFGDRANLNVVEIVPYELVEKIAFRANIEKYDCRIVNITRGDKILYDVPHVVLKSLPPRLRLLIRDYLKMPNESLDVLLGDDEREK